MENIFSLKRFWLLVRKHANENRTIFLYSLVLMIIPAIFIQFFPSNQSLESLSKTYIIFLVLTGGVYTGMFFKDWTYKARAASLLLLPATTLEKFVLVLFYSVVVFISVFTIVYCSSFFVLLRIFHPGIPFSFIDQHPGLSPLAALIIYTFVPYIFFQSIVLLFTVSFKKRQTSKAFGVIVILFYIIGIWNIFYIKWMAGSYSVSVSDQLVYFPTGVYYDGEEGRRIVINILITNVSIIILAICTLMLYLASYFKLKEKEI